jgi:hypothetical protein
MGKIKLYCGAMGTTGNAAVGGVLLRWYVLDLQLISLGEVERLVRMFMGEG